MLVIAVAGRRIDPADAATPRFPLANVSLVRSRVRRFLLAHPAAAVVSGAACGTDLLALAVAGELGLRRRVVVLADLDAYRRGSVTDRPGDWGALFDRVVADADAREDLVRLEHLPAGEAGYLSVNGAILDEAVHLAAQQPRCALLALLVWEGTSRGGDDVTGAFGEEARARGIATEELLTL